MLNLQKHRLGLLVSNYWYNWLVVEKMTARSMIDVAFTNNFLTCTKKHQPTMNNRIDIAVHWQLDIAFSQKNSRQSVLYAEKGVTGHLHWKALLNTDWCSCIHIIIIVFKPYYTLIRACRRSRNCTHSVIALLCLRVVFPISNRVKWPTCCFSKPQDLGGISMLIH